ncbi:hypothetical protein [Limnoglobus roseus]|uniref:Uncharacterized protein n=1 Tax=Limnoglobus roseus TaxID=2598579 RepID=A0A5C1AN68_9BACT|nr:hypothetical protein [Limnoglobus roseus]QEL18654.1 hypothetical protein PX52LOC_05687 [Limnoglobus roseus]
MTIRPVPTFVGMSLALALMLTSEVSAKGVVVVTWGETINHVGTPLDQVRLFHKSNGIGYKYHYFGLFWIDLWTSEGTYCVYDRDKYDAISSAKAAELLGVSESDLSPPFWYRWPPGCVFVGTALVVAGLCRLAAKPLGLGSPVGGQSNFVLFESIKKNLEGKSSEELRQMLEANDREQYSEEAFLAAAALLRDRERRGSCEKPPLTEHGTAPEQPGRD